MKAVRLFTILLLTQVLACAGDTAYQALRIIGKNNQDFLNQVVEVHGTNGQTQPVVWTILVNDQSARGGVRELEVSKGRVISEHTPVRAYAGAATAMDFKRLNLDSQGAFTIANQEAAKHNVGFDSVDYVLRPDEQGAPVWILKLIDVDHVLVGTITIAADSGTVLNTAGFGAPQHGAAPPPPPVANNPPQQGAPPADGGDEPGPDPRNGVGYQINKGLHRFAGTLQQFFTGQRTVDKRFNDGQ